MDSSTPRPWKYHKGLQVINSPTDDRGISDNICQFFSKTDADFDNYEANAQLIVRAVNRDHVFEELVECLKYALDIFKNQGNPVQGIIKLEETLSKASKLTEDKNNK